MAGCLSLRKRINATAAATVIKAKSWSKVGEDSTLEILTGSVAGVHAEDDTRFWETRVVRVAPDLTPGRFQTGPYETFRVVVRVPRYVSRALCPTALLGPRSGSGMTRKGAGVGDGRWR